MAKQIYIDENGNEHLVSGTINTASMLPISAQENTNTKAYIDDGLSGKADSSTTYTKTEVNNLLSGKENNLSKQTTASGVDANSFTTNGIYRNNGNTTNFPYGWGTLIVLSPLGSAIACVQIYIQSNNTAHYRICWDGGTWLAWKQF